MSTNAHHCAGSTPVEEAGHHYPNGGHHIQPRIFHPTHPVQAIHQGKIFYFNIREALLTLSVFDQRLEAVDLLTLTLQHLRTN
jgi:hypothetical protein